LVDRRREVLQPAQLVGSLLGDAEDLGDVDQTQELPACYGCASGRTNHTRIPRGGRRSTSMENTIRRLITLAGVTPS
jgi:hypothetical protein